jgi:C-terminal processing protease CtpA/Prc
MNPGFDRKRNRSESVKAGSAHRTPAALLIITILVLFLPAVVAESDSLSTPQLSLNPDSAVDTRVVSTATREGRLAVFDDLWQTVADRYYSANFHGVDWLAQRSRFRPLAEAAPGSREFYAELRRMLAMLQDAHTRVYAPEEKFDWQHPRFISVGISLREVEGQPTVFTVEPGSQAERAGIRPGDVIVAIGGEPASELLERRQREQTSSTPRAARLMALGALTDGPAGTSIEIEWQDAKAREHQASLRRQWRERSVALRSHQLRKGILLIEVDGLTQRLAF